MAKKRKARGKLVRKKPTQKRKSVKPDDTLKKILEALERRPGTTPGPGLRRSRFETDDAFLARKRSGRRFVQGSRRRGPTGARTRFTKTQQAPAPFHSIFNGIKSPSERLQNKNDDDD